jgi:hypothetical protein
MIHTTINQLIHVLSGIQGQKMWLKDHLVVTNWLKFMTQ